MLILVQDVQLIQQNDNVMSENTKCPVCGKAGIPDFLNEDVKCPCCGSDLSIYRVIEKIPEDGHKFNIWKPISAAAFIAAAVLGVMLYIQKPAAKTTPTEEDTYTQLMDSIKVLNNQLVQMEMNEQPKSEYKYAVLRGDSYWSISKKFYGTGTRAREVAKYNNRTIDTPLIFGDTLIIK